MPYHSQALFVCNIIEQILKVKPSNFKLAIDIGLIGPSSEIKLAGFLTRNNDILGLKLTTHMTVDLSALMQVLKNKKDLRWLEIQALSKEPKIELVEKTCDQLALISLLYINLKIL